MRRIFSPLAATTALILCVASPSWAAGAQENTNTSASVQAGASQDTGFFGKIGQNVRGWFSPDNDAAGRADMAANPSTNTGPSNTAEINADMDAQARANAQTNPAAGASTTRSNLDTGTHVGVGVGSGIGADVGGGTATGMGDVGITADTNIRTGADVNVGTRTVNP